MQVVLVVIKCDVWNKKVRTRMARTFLFLDRILIPVMIRFERPTLWYTKIFCLRLGEFIQLHTNL